MAQTVRKAIQYLRAPTTIRGHCQQVLSLGLADALPYFHVHSARLPEAVAYVRSELEANYPDGVIPYHSRFRHFEAGGYDRIRVLRQHLGKLSAKERGMVLFELVVVSVLLDAGAGKAWSYREASTQKSFSRSEGLAVASFDMFMQGCFSSDPRQPLQADAQALTRLTPQKLAAGLQVSATNPLVGLEGRSALLGRLGDAIAKQSGYFGKGANPRLGELFSYLYSQGKATLNGTKTLAAQDILQAILEALSVIWPHGYQLAGENIGDIGRHPLVKGPHGSDGLVPFHKLSQWLTYSLFEPFEEAGFVISDVNALTGLPEYRNGGLFLDLGVLTLRDPKLAVLAHNPTSELIVEWRALTVALLDLLAGKLRDELGRTSNEFPLVKVLQGGTWSAGRKIAASLRADGGPPLTLDSDGTVF